MAFPVIVKSTKKGLQLVLDGNVPFEILLDNIREKFKNSKDFFENADFSICFKGRTLSLEEQHRIIQIIQDTCNVQILFIMEENELLDEYIQQRIDEILNEKHSKSGQFHKGNICAGQILECENSVVVLGNVFSGGKIISKGNIAVIGHLWGYAFAGAGGNPHSFICAMDMKAPEIRISDYSLNLKKSNYTTTNKKIRTPQIAFAKDKTIVIEPLTNGYLMNI